VNIILFGPPGAGKGTQGDFLANEYNLYKVSTGDLLRREIETESNIGKKLKGIIDQGQLASDEITNNLIESLLSNKEYSNRLIFDGYPRNINQVDFLDSAVKKYNQKISCVFTFKIDKETLLKRITGRQICSMCGSIYNEYFNKATPKNHSCGNKFLQKRSDDNEKILNSRYEIYTKETLPILSFYQNRKILHEIDGSNEIDQINKKIQHIMQALVT